MRFLAAHQLWFLALLPLLLAGYLWLLRRRKAVILAYPRISAVREALLAASSWRRHLPPAILLAARAAMIIGGARPVMEVMLPAASKTIVLAMDVSGSMRATDVAPTRLVAAQAAAKAFVSKLPDSARVAVVAYAGSAHLVQSPTYSKADVFAAIDGFQLQRATAIGDGIIVSLGTIFPSDGITVAAFSASQQLEQAANPPAARPRSAGSYGPAAIVLLSDGQNTSGVDPLAAASFAAKLGVRTFTVGFGTEAGATIEAFGWSMRVRLDERTLKSLAEITAAQYFRAADAAELGDVYDMLNEQLLMEKTDREISSLFANLAAILTVLAAALSLAWFGRVT